MSDYDYGPLRTYEITWRTRPPEMVQGHQVTFDSARSGFIGLLGPASDTALPSMFHIHGMFPGRHWRMVLMGQEADVICIRDVTEQVEALNAMAAEGSDQ